MQFVMLRVTPQVYDDYRADAPRRHAILDALRPLCGDARHTAVL
ncbi:hypothetical protein ALQ33_03362 [Pseudomonas syringae pv. philadelphi]|uniref:Uncharacterized protein n=1 Tax=Pseudomonas syringae pv. philadelphi TaxID=251706 RepID=A0A3M3YJB4_9PSED|nr:hypothetical protein ALQ33_03362 [Pseudomonas syringae pv. philadelphi]